MEFNCEAAFVDRFHWRSDRGKSKWKKFLENLSKKLIKTILVWMNFKLWQYFLKDFSRFGFYQKIIVITFVAKSSNFLQKITNLDNLKFFQSLLQNPNDKNLSNFLIQVLFYHIYPPQMPNKFLFDISQLFEIFLRQKEPQKTASDNLGFLVQYT